MNFILRKKYVNKSKIKEINCLYVVVYKQCRLIPIQRQRSFIRNILNLNQDNNICKYRSTKKRGWTKGQFKLESRCTVTIKNRDIGGKIL